LQHESSKERIIALIDADQSMLGTFTDDVSMQRMSSAADVLIWRHT
jgi:hypothetical protein